MNPTNTAYILLWFPKPSETFIFCEAKNLLASGLPLSVYTLYGKLSKNISTEMRSYRGKVLRLGISHIVLIPVFISYWLFKSPMKTCSLISYVIFRKWRGLEKTAENMWAFLCSFYLAYRFKQDKISHIHAPWACGCATAAWFTSKLTGIPFSFTIRAWDIYPPDSLIHDKTQDAIFIRSETRYNIHYFRELTGCPPEKMHLTYNGVPIKAVKNNPTELAPPYNLLSVGRLVGKKGFEYLISACRFLKDQDIDFHLNIVGDGPYMRKLKLLSSSLNLTSHISFTGFQSYDRIPDYYKQADIFIMPCIVHSSGDRDGIPTVLLEALLNYLPVITTPVSGIPELIEDGVTGILVPPENPARLAEAVMRIIKEKEKSMKMTIKGHEKVSNLFDPLQNHHSVTTLYSNYFN